MVQTLSYEELKARIGHLEQEIAEAGKREEALRSSESKYRALFEASNTGYLIVDEAGTILDASSEYVRITGNSSLEAIKGKNILNWTATHDIKKNEQAFERCLFDGFVRDLEISYVDNAGNLTPVEINARTLRLPEGVRIISLCRDVTQRQRMEKKLRETANQYRELVKNANSIIIRMDLHGNVTYFNEFAQKFFGYEQKEILGRNVVGTIIPKRESSGRDLKSMIEDIGKHPERYVNNENENICKNGTRVWIAWTNKPFYDADGKVIETLCIGNDITPRKKFEKALEEREELFKTLTEDAPFGISIMNQDSKFEFFNNKFTELFGYSLENLPDKQTWFEKAYPEESYREKVISVWKADLFEDREVDESKSRIFTIRTKDGQNKIVDMRSVVLRDGKHFVTYEDITASKKAEGVLRESEQRFRTLAEAAPFGISIVNSDQSFIYFNPKFTEILGYTLHDVPNKQTWFEQAYPDETYRKAVVSAWKEDLFNNKRVGGIKPQIFTVRCKDGKDKIIHFRTVALKNGQQFLTYEDITTRAKAEKLLKESEEKFRILAETTPSAVMMYQNDKWVYANSAACKMSGYSQEEILSMNYWDFVHPDYKEMIKERGGQRQEGVLGIKRYDFKIIRKSGEERWVDLSGASLTDYKGKPAGIISVIDVTDRKEMENSLRESEERFRSIVENSHDGIVIADGNYRLIYANDEVCRMIGYPRDDIIGQDFRRFLTKESKKLVGERYIQRRSGEKVPDRYKFEIIRKDGDIRWVEIKSSMIKDSAGELRSISQILDITEHKKAEDALKENELKYRALFESSPDAILLSDRTGIFDCNWSTLRIFGLGSKDEIIGRHPGGRELSPLIQPDGSDSLKSANVHTIKAVKEGWNFFEWVHKKADGSLFFTEVLLNRFELEGRHVLQVIVRDITERKKADQDLKDSEQRLKEIVDFQPDAMLAIDLKAKVISWNRAMEELTGVATEEMVGKDNYEYALPFYGKRRPILVDMVLDSNEDLEKQYSFIKKEKGLLVAETDVPLVKGEKRILWAKAAPVYNAAGEVVGAIESIRDITERRLTEEKQRGLEEQLHQAQKMEAVGTLAGGIAHDFNNLIMGIQGWTELILMDTDPGHPHFERLKHIENIAKSTAGLTKQLLGFARRGKYQVRPIDLNDLVMKSSQMFGHTRKEITINAEYQKDIWIVEADWGQIEQVLLNLYINGWEAMKGEGKLYLQTENVVIDKDYVKPLKIKPGRYVKISVTDSGVGMDKKTREKIFDPFFTTKDMGGGTGLGLASAYGIIKNHEGIINVYSEKGKGATFIFYLPASEKKRNQKEKTPELIVKGKETILLIDDEEMVINIAEELLKFLGYHVFMAQSGEEAIEIYKKQSDDIDIVILDMVMPNMGGGKTYDRLKKIDPDIKVLLSSGYSINGEADKILKRGCNGFIQKPFNISLLSQKIRKILGKDN